MITPDNQIVRAVDTIDLTTIRSAVVDEDGHIRELPAAECRRFSWDEEVFKRLGVKDDCDNLARVENGRHVLPLKYLRRLLDALGQKAIITRPVVDGTE